MSEFPVQVTIKPPVEFNSAPWLNFQAEDQATLTSHLVETFPTISGETLPILVAQAFLEYKAVLTAAIGLAAPAAPRAASIQSEGPAPQWATAAPAAAPSGPPPPQCSHIGTHGPMVYREGNGAKGAWKAWFCPAPKGDPGQCKPQFIR
jgi:hypothetical protein